MPEENKCTGEPEAAAPTTPPASRATLLGEMLRLNAAGGIPIRFQAFGSSMRPCIRNGDRIVVEPLADRVPQVGDIVAFLHPAGSQVIVHRVVRRVGDSYWIQGDRTGTCDGPVPRSNLLGIVSTVERGGRRRRLGLGPERRLIAAVIRSPLLRRSLRLTKRFFVRPDRHSPSTTQAVDSDTDNQAQP